MNRNIAHTGTENPVCPDCGEENTDWRQNTTIDPTTSGSETIVECDCGARYNMILYLVPDFWTELL